MLRELDAAYIDEIMRLEADPIAGQFIQAYSRERHVEEFARPDIRYLGIETDSVPPQLDGFILLKLEKESSVEFRRIVVAKKNKGTGRKAIDALHVYCRERLNASRIWLDFFENNLRAKHVYLRAGYVPSGESELNGRRLIIMTKNL
jgi:RimJ/RimL family protein N-acetyltransferase